MAEEKKVEEMVERKIRFDEFGDFHNPTEEDFVGRWDGEDYIIARGGTEMFPDWLRRHFAKRLCDQAMIKLHKVPLREGDAERKEFMILCLGEESVVKDESEPVQLTTKEQIDQNRDNIIKQERERVANEKAIADKRAEEDEESEEDLAKDLAVENTDAQKTGKGLKKINVGKADDDGEFEGTIENASVNLQEQLKADGAMDNQQPSG